MSAAAVSTAFVAKSIRLIVPANKAKPSPQIGQSLGSIGLNMMKFCKEFNGLSVKFRDDVPLRVKLKSFSDGQSNFTVHLPQSSHFIKQLAEVPLGAHETGHELVGAVHVKQLFEVAKLKQSDSDELKMTSLKAIFTSLVHQCKSMGIYVDFATDYEMEVRRLNQVFRDAQTRLRLKELEDEEAKEMLAGIEPPKP